MGNSLRYTLVASLLLHIGFFTLLSARRSSNVMQISFPVEMLTPPPSGGQEEAAAAPEKTEEPAAKTIIEKVREIMTEKKEIVAEKTVVKKKAVKKTVSKPKEKDEAKKKNIPKETGAEEGIKKTTSAYGDSGLMSSLRLDNAKFPYTYYARGVRRIVDGNWDYSKFSGNARAVVYFKIKPTGEMEGVKIYESSGNKIFDLLAKNAVERSQFPPLPSDYKEEYLGIYFEFIYHD
jgi:TonB family protein